MKDKARERTYRGRTSSPGKQDITSQNQRPGNGDSTIKKMEGTERRDVYHK